MYGQRLPKPEDGEDSAAIIDRGLDEGRGVE